MIAKLLIFEGIANAPYIPTSDDTGGAGNNSGFDEPGSISSQSSSCALSQTLTQNAQSCLTEIISQHGGGYFAVARPDYQYDSGRWLFGKILL